MEGEQLGAAEGGKRVLALWELRREERETKLWLDADELEYMMEGEQLGTAEGGKLESMMEGEQLRLAKGGKLLQALWEMGRGEREMKLRL